MFVSICAVPLSRTVVGLMNAFDKAEQALSGVHPMIGSDPCSPVDAAAALTLEIYKNVVSYRQVQFKPTVGFTLC